MQTFHRFLWEGVKNSLLQHQRNLQSSAFNFLNCLLQYLVLGSQHKEAHYCLVDKILPPYSTSNSTMFSGFILSSGIGCYCICKSYWKSSRSVTWNTPISGASRVSFMTEKRMSHWALCSILKGRLFLFKHIFTNHNTLLANVIYFFALLNFYGYFNKCLLHRTFSTNFTLSVCHNSTAVIIFLPSKYCYLS